MQCNVCQLNFPGLCTICHCLIICLVLVTFGEYKLAFNKIYENPAEDRRRRQIYERNVFRLEKSNKVICDGVSNVYSNVTRFTDQSFEEVGASYTGGGTLGKA